jgi:hypothetical protein
VTGGVVLGTHAAVSVLQAEMLTRAKAYGEAVGHVRSLATPRWRTRQPQNWCRPVACREH